MKKIYIPLFLATALTIIPTTLFSMTIPPQEQSNINNMLTSPTTILYITNKPGALAWIKQTQRNMGSSAVINQTKIGLFTVFYTSAMQIPTLHQRLALLQKAIARRQPLTLYLLSSLAGYNNREIFMKYPTHEAYSKDKDAAEAFFAQQQPLQPIQPVIQLPPNAAGLPSADQTEIMRMIKDPQFIYVSQLPRISRTMEYIVEDIQQQIPHFRVTTLPTSGVYTIFYNNDANAQTRQNALTLIRVLGTLHQTPYLVKKLQGYDDGEIFRSFYISNRNQFEADKRKASTIFGTIIQ